VPPFAANRTWNLDNLAHPIFSKHFCPSVRGTPVEGFSPHSRRNTYSISSRTPIGQASARALQCVETGRHSRPWQQYRSPGPSAEIQHPATNGSHPMDDIHIGSLVSLDKLEEIHIRRVLDKTASLTQASGVLELIRLPCIESAKRSAWNDRSGREKFRERRKCLHPAAQNVECHQQRHGQESTHQPPKPSAKHQRDKDDEGIYLKTAAQKNGVIKSASSKCQTR